MAEYLEDYFVGQYIPATDVLGGILTELAKPVRTVAHWKMRSRFFLDEGSNL